jgi:hypothetical protein
VIILRPNGKPEMPGKKRKEKLLFRNSMLKVCSRWRAETKNYVSGTKAKRVASLPHLLGDRRAHPICSAHPTMGY